MENSDPNSKNICIGIITSVNGVKGYVKIKNYTESHDDLANFDNIFDDEGRIYKISLISQKKDCVVAAIEGVNSRNEAETLRNRKLYIKRSSLPEVAEEEYYHADLVGLEAKYGDGSVFGTVIGVMNFGAGDILELHDASMNKSVYYPFSKQFVPEINISEKYIIITQLEEVVPIDDEEEIEENISS